MKRALAVLVVGLALLVSAAFSPRDGNSAAYSITQLGVYAGSDSANALTYNPDYAGIESLSVFTGDPRATTYAIYVGNWQTWGTADTLFHLYVAPATGYSWPTTNMDSLKVTVQWLMGTASTDTPVWSQVIYYNPKRTRPLVPIISSGMPACRVDLTWVDGNNPGGIPLRTYIFRLQ